MLKKELGNRLKKARLEMGLTQEDMAKKLLVNRSLISYYETGKTLPSIIQLYKISIILKKDISFFFKD